MLKRDLRRDELETQPLLVLGQPAGGKTTFCKQLLTWTMRQTTQGDSFNTNSQCDDPRRHEHLIPVMVRVVELVRNEHQFAPGLDSIDAFLKLECSQVRYRFFRKARDEKRLLVILDGFDEAGPIEERLEREIQQIYVHDVFLVAPYQAGAPRTTPP